jgi:hypothetical protein
MFADSVTPRRAGRCPRRHGFAHIALGGQVATALLLREQTGHDVDALAVALHDPGRTGAAARTPSAPDTRASTKAVMRSCA